jgi:hypothetical protein
MTDLSAFAAGEFQRLRGNVQKACNDGTIAREAAEAGLWPWLAIAIAAGNSIGDLLDLDAEARRFAYDICEPAEWREVLAKARDAVIDADRADEWGRNILALADALHCRPWTPKAILPDAERIAA